MPDPASLLKLLPAALASVGKVRRWWSRGKTMKSVLRGGDVPDPLDQSLEEALNRLSGGRPGDPFWRRAQSRLDRWSLGPRVLRGAAEQQILQDEQARADLIELATAKALKRDAPEARKRLETLLDAAASRQASANAADSLPDRIARAMVASHKQAIPPEARGVVEEFRARLDALSPGADPVVEREHTKRVTDLLDGIVKERCVPALQAARRIRDLLADVEEGTLRGADARTKNDVRYWAARLLAEDRATVAAAREHLAALPRSYAEFDVVIVEARIAETEDDHNRALDLLSDPDSADRRSSYLGALARIRGTDDALTWFDSIRDDHPSDFLTAPGWHTWAFCMAEVGRWEEATARLSGLDDHWQADAALLLTEGRLNAAMLLPANERSRTLNNIPVYPGITPSHPPAAEVYAARARECFTAARAYPGIANDPGFADFVDTWQLWLRLMDPDPARSSAARAEVGKKITAEPAGFALVPFAWAFGIEFDATTVRTRLVDQRGAGQFSSTEWAAECLSNQLSMPPRDFVRYLESHWTRLTGIMPEPFLAELKIRALVADGQPARARDDLERVRETLGPGASKSLELWIQTNEGEDRRSELEALYRESNQLPDLKALIHYLQEVDDRDALPAWLEELFNEWERTVENAVRLVGQQMATDRVTPQKLVDFLDDNEDLVAHSPALRAARANALFGVGDYGKAREVNDALRKERTSVHDDMLAIQIAVWSGDWERVPGILDRVWSERESCDADTLMQLAHLAADHSESGDRASELGRLATKKAPCDPQILMGAFELFVRSGRDAEVDPSWLRTALQQSSEETGPLWEIPVRSVVEEVIPDRRRAAERMNRELLGGRLPLSVAAVANHTSLAHVFLHSPEENAAAGGLERGIIPIVAGGRPPLDLSASATVGLDVTSIMALAHLGVLEEAVEGLPRIAVSPGIFSFLFTERRRTQFHQPLQLREAAHLIELRHRDRIRPTDVGGLGDEEDGLAAEVGPESAALIRAARREKGLVVEKLPIYRPDSVMEREANTAEFGDLLVSAPTLLHALSRAGHLAAADRGKLERLGSRADLLDGEPSGSLLKKPIFLATSALSELRRTKLLDAATAAGLDLRLHPRVFARAESLVKDGETADRLRRRLNKIRDALRSGLEAKKVVLLPRRALEDWPQGGPPEGFESTAFLMEAADQCDAVCFGDRALNRLPGIPGPDGLTPIASVLDVLRTLRDRKAIDSEEYGATRHRLRDGGFAFVAPEADEVLTLVKQASVQDGQLIENPELRALRQAGARLAKIEPGEAGDIQEFATATIVAMARALRSLWEDSGGKSDEVEARASYVWWEMTDFTLGLAEPLDGRGAAGVRSARLRLCIETVLPPLVGVPPEVTARYASWLEDSILSELRPAHGSAILAARDAVRESLDSSDDVSALLGNLFLKQLPESLSNGVLLQHPDFAERCGFRLQQSISVEGVGIEVPVLFDAVRRAFQTGRPAAVADTEAAKGLSVVADVRSGEVAVTWDENGHERGVRIPTLGVLAPSKEARIRALEEARRRYGPTFDLSPFVRTAEKGALADRQASVVLEEGARGVAWRQKGLADKIREGGGLTIADFVPSDVSYYERFCGPDPEGKELEQYVRDILIPYRKTLLGRDLAEGLQICLLGTVRDDLSPGEWTRKANREKVWGVLSSGLPTRTPFWLLGALDTALYHLEDPRFRDFAAEAVDMLLDENLRRDEDPGIYRVFGVLTEVIRTGVTPIEGFYRHPPYWRRMCVLMQAGLICHLSPPSAGTVNLAPLVDWTKRNQSAAAYVAEVAGLRDDPVRLPEPTDVALTRGEVLARFYMMQKRHEADGRALPRGDRIGPELAASGLLGPSMTTGFPGPLDRHVVPVQQVEPEVVQHYENVGAEKGEKEFPSALGVLSMHFRLDADTMRRVHQHVRSSLAAPLDERAQRADRASFQSLVMIAVSQRNVLLADAVGDALVRYSGAANRPESVGEVVGLLCQLAPSIEAEDQRASWLQERFKRVAEALPVEMLSGYLLVLRALEVVLPCDAWFHMPAKRVARARAA